MAIVGRVYECALQNCNITESNLTVSSVTGDHNSGKSDVNVTAISVYGQVMHFFPAGFAKFFQNLEAIFMKNPGLKSLNNADIKEFDKLRFFQIREHELKILSSDLFKFNTNLEFVGFQEGPLEHVGFGLLWPLKKLKKAFFGYNTCIQKVVMEEAEIEAFKVELEEKCPETKAMRDARLARVSAISNKAT